MAWESPDCWLYSSLSFSSARLFLEAAFLAGRMFIRMTQSALTFRVSR